MLEKHMVRAMRLYRESFGPWSEKEMEWCVQGPRMLIIQTKSPVPLGSTSRTLGGIPALLPHLPLCSYTHPAFLFIDTPTAFRIYLSSWWWLHSRYDLPGPLHSMLSTWSAFNLLQPLNLELAPSSGLCICWNLLLLDLSRTTSFSSIRSLGNAVSWETPPF